MVTTEKLQFPGATGAPLTGILHRPDGEVTGSVLLVHCFTCGKDLRISRMLADALADAGLAAMRFDMTGLGESGGEFADTTVTTTVRDVVRAATALIERGYGPCGLFGHSLGGAAALLAADRLKTVRSVGVLAAPATAAHLRRLLTDDEETIRAEGCAMVDIGGRPFPISEEFLAEVEKHDALDHIGELGRPLAVFHAVDDRIVSIDEGERIFAAARQPKAFIPLLDADHLLTDRTSAQRAVEAITDWFVRTL